ncbi:MAG: hypothetical protein QOC77_1698 [Thermoleophilaceae bacterium]|jgi:hypothetical protein|nr:hypothetical protein [Thermoleophilaceae bacterium]
MGGGRAPPRHRRLSQHNVNDRLGFAPGKHEEYPYALTRRRQATRVREALPACERSLARTSI